MTSSLEYEDENSQRFNSVEDIPEDPTEKAQNRFHITRDQIIDYQMDESEENSYRDQNIFMDHREFLNNSEL